MNGNSKGATFSQGGFDYKIVLPHFSGFSDFCLRLFGADLSAMQLQVGAGAGAAAGGCAAALRLAGPWEHAAGTLV